MDQALHISYTFTLDDDDTEDDSFQKMYNMHGSERVNRQSDVDGVARSGSFWFRGPAGPLSTGPKSSFRWGQLKKGAGFKQATEKTQRYDIDITMFVNNNNNNNNYSSENNNNSPQNSVGLKWCWMIFLKTHSGPEHTTFLFVKAGMFGMNNCGQ